MRQMTCCSLTWKSRDKPTVIFGKTMAEVQTLSENNLGNDDYRYWVKDIEAFDSQTEIDLPEVSNKTTKTAGNAKP